MSKLGKGTSLEAKLWRYEVDPDTGCWNYTGWKDSSGYGNFKHQRNNVTTIYRAHRLAWELQNNQEIPEGMFVCHHCDNPACINPEHLFLGTAQDNSDDKHRKGRGFKGQPPGWTPPTGRKAKLSHPGSKNAKSKLTEAQAQRIKNREMTIREACEEFDVHPGTVISIRNGRSWRHLP